MLFAAFITVSCKIGDRVSVSSEWTTVGELRVPESVLHDNARDVLYVSNIGGLPTKKDGDGFISRLSLDGKILNFEWISGMDAPKGMALLGNTLYVTDIDRIHLISVPQGRIRESIGAEGAKFLNDIAIDDAGTVYVSDMVMNRIYTLKKGKFSVWLEFKDYTGINGMLFDEESVFAGSEQGILKINPATGDTMLYIPLTGGIDGLRMLDDDRFIVSDWKGKIQVVAPGKEPRLLMNTTEQKINAADIEYIPENKLLLVPTFFDNRIMAYTVD